MRPIFWVVGVIVIIAIFAVSGMNKIPRLEEGVNAQWAQVQNEYQRRSDLIPNLVETVKGYAKHEHDTLNDVIQARANATKVTIDASQLSDPAALQRFEQAQGQLTQALSKLMAISENYPNLKANENFIALQSQLEGTENRIAVARRDYIAAVQSYNVQIRTFPGFLWAKFLNAKPKANFTATTPNAETAPKVQF